MPGALDLVHRDRAANLEPLGRRARLGQLGCKRHREAGRMRGGRSSSGLVFPSAAPIRVGSEYDRPAKAPDVAAVIAPEPRARFPSQTTSDSRTIRGISSRPR